VNYVSRPDAAEAVVKERCAAGPTFTPIAPMLPKEKRSRRWFKKMIQRVRHH